MITGYFIVVFSKNSVFSADHIDITKKKFTKNRHYLDDEVPSGEYVVVTCEVGRPEVYKIGITKIEARQVTVTKSLELRDLYYIHEKVPIKTKTTSMPYNDLTKRLYEDTIKIIREKGFGPWWDNAPKEVKDTLQVSKKGFFNKFIRKKVSIDPKEMMSIAMNSYNKAMQEMRNLPNDEPCLSIWEKAIGEFTNVIGTKVYNELAIYFRARAYYYAGKYIEAIKDLDNFFSDGHRFNPAVHIDISPKTLRAMARIELRQFSNAEEDLHEEIWRLQEFMGQQSINRSTENYWLLVCKHKGDRNAAITEQSKFY